MATAPIAGLGAQQIRYDATDLGIPPGASALGGVIAEAISPDGRHICGGSWDPYVWDEGAGMRRLPLPAGQSAGFVADVDDRGYAVGYAGLSAPPYYRAVAWDPAGTLMQLHQSGWVWSRVDAIGAAGEMLLSASVPNGTSLGAAHAYLRTAGGSLVDLTPASTIGRGLDLDRRGSALFQDANSIVLRDPGGIRFPIPNAFSAWKIGGTGEVLGVANGDLARWSPGGAWQVIPDPTLRINEIGGMNRFGQVVATHIVPYQSSPPRYFRYGWIYTDGLGWTDLATVVDPALQITVKAGAGITDQGVIAAYGSIGPDNRAMRLVPRYVTAQGQGCPDGSGEEVRAWLAGDVRGGGRISLLGAGGPPNALGAFLVGTRAQVTPLPGGCPLLVDPASTVAMQWTTAVDRRAWHTVQIPASLAGQRLYLQYGVSDPGAGNGSFALSNLVAFDIQ